MCIAVIGQNQSGIGASKFKEVVHKQILATKLEKVQKQHMEDLNKAVEDLQKHCEMKRQEAKEKLVRGLILVQHQVIMCS